MTNHPNRGPKGPQSNPGPTEIRAAREAAGLTQTQAASLVFSGLRAWQQWEAGDRRMPPSTWALFGIKVRAAESEGAFRTWWGDGVDQIDEAIARDAWAAAVAQIMGN